MCINKRQSCEYRITNRQPEKRETGRLEVTVKNRLTNEPVSFANVRVYHLTIRGLYGESGEANLVAIHTTDEEGKIPLIELPVIERSSTVQYYMTVNHFRYYPVNLMNIQIYPNITTDYNIMLTPLTATHPDYEFIITPETF